jgi:hypothetical protein
MRSHGYKVRSRLWRQGISMQLHSQCRCAGFKGFLGCVAYNISAGLSLVVRI